MLSYQIVVRRAVRSVSFCLHGIASASNLNIRVHVLARRSFLSRWIWNRTGFAALLIQWTTVGMRAAKSMREYLTVSLKSLTQSCCDLSSYHGSDKEHPELVRVS
jgi:hypothetical protein